MSRAEGQPKSSREHKLKAGRIASYMLSATITIFGVKQAAQADSNYDQFLRDNPSVALAQTQISDFNIETNRVFSELDKQGLNELGERFPVISAARQELEENKGKIPDPIDAKMWGMMEVLGGLYVGFVTFVITKYKDKIKRKNILSSI